MIVCEMLARRARWSGHANNRGTCTACVGRFDDSGVAHAQQSEMDAQAYHDIEKNDRGAPLGLAIVRLHLDGNGRLPSGGHQLADVCLFEWHDQQKQKNSSNQQATAQPHSPPSQQNPTNTPAGAPATDGNKQATEQQQRAQRRNRENSR